MTTPTITIGDRYHLEDTIGQGGMGTVYRATDTQTATVVAIKHLKKDVVGEDATMLERFRREADLLKQLNHPNIVHMQDIVDEDGEHYIVLEYVPGGSLSDELRKHATLPVERVLQIALDLADALTRAHRLGVVHRDLKPANVLLADDGTPRLSDFGIAHMQAGESITRTGAILGTAAYLAPEVLRDGTVDERSDIWSCGILLFQLLTGRVPFDNHQPLATLITAILTKPVPDITTLRADIPSGLRLLIYRMLEKEPAKRIGSIRQVAAQLEALMNGTSETPIRVMQEMSPVEDADGTTMRMTGSFTSTSDTLSLVKNAPPLVDKFVGRGVDLGEVLTTMQSADVRLMTITGPGGMGKSSLGVRVAAEIAIHYADGAVFVPLAMISEPQYVPQGMADALDLDFVPGELPQRQLANFLREKHMLVVLDNFEHVMDAADLIAELLTAAPRVTFLVTSRERLNLRNEYVHTLTGLSVPDDTGDLSTDYESIDLFTTLARRTNPDFDPTEDPGSIMRIVRLVDGSPLAIQLAAAWLSVLPLDEIADEIAESFDFLETELRDVPTRQRSMRAVFEYSWQTLEQRERDALRDLTVFMSGFTREGAKQVAKASLRVLKSLVDKSLINVNRKGHYWIHGMVRTYAREKLEEQRDQFVELQKRMVGYYASMLNQKFNAEQADWDAGRVELIGETGNIREAWRIAAEMGLSDALDAMTYPLWYLFETRSSNDEALELYSMAFDQCTADEQLRVKLNLSRAWFTMRNNDLDAAYDMAMASMPQMEEANDQPSVGLANNIISYILYRRGDYAAALNYAEKSAVIFDDNRVWWGAGLGFGNLGYIHLMRGNYDAARAALQQAYDMSRTARNSFALAYASNNLGEVYLRTGDLDRAQELFRQSLECFKVVEFRSGKAFAYANLGEVARLRGDFSAEAYEYFEKGINIYQEVGDQTGVAAMLIARGRFALAAGAYEEAHYQLEHGLLIYRNIGKPNGMALALRLLGETAYVLDKLESAEEYFRESLLVARDSDSEKQMLEAMFGLASLKGERGNHTHAAAAMIMITLHPATDYETKQRARRTFEALSERMDATDVQTARDMGAKKNLREVVEAILNM